MDNQFQPLSAKFSGHLSELPAPLQAELTHFFEDFPQDYNCDFIETDTQQKQLLLALIGSPFLREQLLHSPQLLKRLFEPTSGLEGTECQKSDVNYQLEFYLDNANTFDAFNKALRVFRNHFMAEVIFRDFNRLNSTLQTTRQLSYLAEVCLQHAINYHYRFLQQRHGVPRNENGDTQPLLVLGMGKLGAWELNLSSDIDLIFAYPESGNTDHPTNAISNQEFFNLLGKAIIQSLDNKTVDGFVFRVDMRLRPWGSSGALVSNFDSLENYYQTQGREWERYAMVKARVVATNGSPMYTQELMELLQNFTYRQYVDFSVIEALRGLKQSINEEVRRKKLFEDIKRGSGGIREVEFIAQVFQLVRGGRDRQLRDNRLLKVLPALASLGCLTDETVNALREAYLFLRNTEHALQGYKDQQTQALPSQPLQQYCLARVMGFSCWDTFYAQLNIHRKRVAKEFHEIIANPDEDATQQKENIWHLVWQAPDNPDIFSKVAASFESPEQALALLQDLHNNSTVNGLQPQTRSRLDSFIPLLLAAVTNTERPTETLHRLLPMVKAVLRRSAYLLLLIENPSALEQLVTLASASPWIAEQLATHPALLDELLDSRSLYTTPDKHTLQSELFQHMSHIDEDDLEAQMEHLRYFRSAHALRVAACEVTGVMPLMKVSDYLTFLAEAVLEYTLQLAWKEMTKKHGFPDGDERETPNFLVVGYGKVGGIELGHSSDLDLVFIHGASMLGATDGNARGLKELDNNIFYTRLGQKMIHILNTKTVSGQLYDIDMRLRPSGNSGLLVTSLSGFQKYQNENAWTWEHQALVRSRPLAGEPTLAEAFNKIRVATLCQKRDLTQLRTDVREMREKMRTHLGNDKTGDGSEAFHIKQDSGGIVDIEFMVQYAVLAWSQEQPRLATYTDNIRILESLEQSNMLSAQEVEQLTEAYKVFRSIGHRLALQHQPSLVDGSSLNAERKKVQAIWHKLLENN